MKKISALLLLFIALISCGGNDQKPAIADVIEQGDLKAIRAKRGEIMAEYSEMQTKIKQLDVAISELDTLKKLPLVTTYTTKESLFKHYLELQGNVETKQNMVLFPEYSGILSRVYVKEGQRVRKGQTLATIDDGGLSQQVAQLEIQASLAKTTYERQQRLWEQKIGSEIQYLQAKANYEAQEKAVAQLKNQLGKTAIRAPFSGTIDEVITEQGSVVASGQSQILRIVSLNNMYISTEVPEKYIASLKKGTEVKVNLPVLGDTITTKIRQVGNFINPVNRSFKIEVAIPNKNGLIKPNLTSKVQINDYTQEKAILIPQSIISENAAGDQYTYVVANPNDDGEAIAKRVIIETGLSQGDHIEVVRGIKSGDALIQEGARSVKDGQTVKIINK